MQTKLRSIRKISANHTGKPDMITRIVKDTGNISIPDNLMKTAIDVWETAYQNTTYRYLDSATIGVATVLRYVLGLAASGELPMSITGENCSANK